jgi:[glutamine synthetase] adenylyltransferase / [glutamine synthetase]-adenylyl-L-tyrosine phosphorylase
VTAEIELAFRFSRYAAQLSRRDGALVDAVRGSADDRPDLNAWRRELADVSIDTIDQRLRRMRRELMLRTLVRDIVLRADFRELVSDLTQFADIAVEAAARAHWRAMSSDADRAAAELPACFSVAAMGKMGGGELNVSSDIDIVYLCDDPPVNSMGTLQRLASAITRTLNREIDGDFVFRVDTRLRPYGDAGPMVTTLDFLEHYFVSQGRMWERIAWLRSRVCAGGAGDALASLVLPFVYRRYLDFDAISGMRDLHTQLRAEKTNPRNIKLGRGGIRELEFGVQLRQLLRGGRDARVRTRNTLDALASLGDAGYIDRSQASELDRHYRFLRRVEHFLQYRDDQQTQTLPSDQNELGALAEALGTESVDAFEREIASVREAVALFFDGTLQGTSGATTPIVSEASTRVDTSMPQTPIRVFDDEERVRRFLVATLESTKLKSIPAVSRTRLEQLANSAIALSAETATPDDAAIRTLDLLSALASRSSYLALMTERPNVLRRVVDLAATSEWAVRYLTRHPLLLDELIDARSLSENVDYGAWHAELSRALDATGEDTEAGMDALRHFQQAETFRLLLRDIAGQLTVETLSDHLSALADVCVDVTLRKLLAASKLPMAATLSVIAYGKWGSKELGYASDLDLIFLMPNEAVEFRDQLTRVAQRLQNWLTTLTPAGRAYEIDVRLRPDGVSGLLLSTLDAFATYQREKAWTWEHQAITRARFAAGNRALGAAFEKIRDEIIAIPRDWTKLRTEILEMRERIAKEHPNRDRDTLFDLKHDRGGLVDMEFAVQALVLRYGATHPSMRLDHGNIALAKRAGSLGLLGDRGEAIANAAADAYRTLRKKQHAVRLRGAEKARVPRDEAVAIAADVQAFFERTFEANIP